MYGPAVPTWLGFVWTLPNTALGLVLGLFTFQVPRAAHGLLLFDRVPRGLSRAMLAFHRTAMTVGFVVLAAAPLQGTLLAHERAHVRQYCLLGPLFIPVYLVLAIPYGYRRHPLEIRARRAAGEPE